MNAQLLHNIPSDYALVVYIISHFYNGCQMIGEYAPEDIGRQDSLHQKTESKMLSASLCLLYRPVLLAALSPHSDITAKHHTESCRRQ